MSGVPSAEAAPIVRAIVLGAACGISAGLATWAIIGRLIDRAMTAR